jgi:hypothetical protein
VYFHERFLRHIVRIVVVPENAEGNIVCLFHVRFDQYTERIVTSLSNVDYQVLLICSRHAR